MRAFHVILLLLFINIGYSQSFLDARNNKSYSYTKIDNLFWFKENIDYKVNGSWCYDEQNYCSSEGRLYTFETAKDICPNGWRLPTSDEVLGRDKTGNLWNNKASKLVSSYTGYRRTKNGGEFKAKGQRFAMWAEHNGNAVMASSYPNRETFDCDFISGGIGLSVRCVTERVPNSSDNKVRSYDDKRSMALRNFLKNSRVTKNSIPISTTQYDGVYAKRDGKYYELEENEMSCDHFIFPNEGYPKRYRFWGEYPKVCYTRTAHRTTLTNHPTKLILKGSQFTDANLEHLSVNPVEVIKLSPNLYFHTGGSSWYEDGYAFLPKWDRKTEKYYRVEIKKKKLGHNHIEILLSDELEKHESYMITCKDKIWMFTSKEDLQTR